VDLHARGSFAAGSILVKKYLTYRPIIVLINHEKSFGRGNGSVLWMQGYFMLKMLMLYQFSFQFSGIKTVLIIKQEKIR